MSRVTLEGSVTPSTYLAMGARLTVERTPYVDKLIRKGYVNLVRAFPEDETTGESAPVELAPAPPAGASKARWTEFLNARGIAYPAGAVKAQLIEAWRAHG